MIGQVLRQDTVNGFSLSFCQALLRRLIALRDIDRIYNEGIDQALKWEESSEVSAASLTRLTRIIAKHLADQIQMNRLESLTKPSEFKDFLSTVQEFLAIFESPQE
jgi:hypothetical protein